MKSGLDIRLLALHTVDTALHETPLQKPAKPLTKKLPSYTIALKPSREHTAELQDGCSAAPQSAPATTEPSARPPPLPSIQPSLSSQSTFVVSMREQSIHRSQTYGLNTQTDLAGDMVFRVLERNVRLTLWIMIVSIVTIVCVGIFSGIRQVFICTDMTITALCVKLFFDQHIQKEENGDSWYKRCCLIKGICCPSCFHALIFVRIETRRDTFRASQHASLAALRNDLCITVKDDASMLAQSPGRLRSRSPATAEEGEESHTDTPRGMT